MMEVWLGLNSIAVEENNLGGTPGSINNMIVKVPLSPWNTHGKKGYFPKEIPPER